MIRIEEYAVACDDEYVMCLICNRVRVFDKEVDKSTAMQWAREHGCCKIRLYLVHVTTTLENDFEAGCYVCVKANTMAEARNKAQDVESEAVGSDDDSIRQTTTDSVHLVPIECENFIREVFDVN